MYPGYPTSGNNNGAPSAPLETQFQQLNVGFGTAQHGSAAGGTVPGYDHHPQQQVPGFSHYPAVPGSTPAASYPPATGPTAAAAGYPAMTGAAPQAAAAGYPPAAAAGAPPAHAGYPAMGGTAPAQAHAGYPGMGGTAPAQAHAGYPAMGGSAPAQAAPGYPGLGGSAPPPGSYPQAPPPQQQYSAVPGSFGTYQPASAPPGAGGRPASAAPAAAAAAAAAPETGASGQGPQAAPGGWLLKEPLPQKPSQQIMGPFLRFNDYDPATGVYEASVLVVAHPDLEGRDLQVHYGVNGPAATLAPSMLLDSYLGYRFLRFDLRVTLADHPGVAAYTVGLVGASAPHCTHSFHLPARGEPWRWVFYSCNGFHEHDREKLYGGIEHLWTDLQQRHEQAKFHLQVGGGDQLYCDEVWSCPSVLSWVAVEEPHERARGPFTSAMLSEVEQYYFGNYSKHFGAANPSFSRALATIPFVYTWDDHDIFDGWGSYPEYLQHSAVFQGMYAVARRFYLLFQMHANYQNVAQASRCLGRMAYHQVRSLGPTAVLIAADTRAERNLEHVVPEADWNMILGEAERRMAASRGQVRHLCFLVGVPMLYPKLPVVESAMGGISGALARSNEMREALRKAGKLPPGAVNQFMEVDLLDDLKDHWTAGEHIKEKEFLIRKLQGLSQRYGVRVTFLGGDVHVGAFGCLQGHPKVMDRVLDPRFMMQVVSSAIGNEPPPKGVAGALETSSMANTQLKDTLEKMIKAFPGKKKLWVGRNYCEVLPLGTPYTEPSTGIPQPPGGLMFVLRCETGEPGKWGPVEAHWQVAPLLLPNGNPAVAAAGGYGAIQAPATGPAGVINQVAGMLPGEAGAKAQQEIKKLGHALGNFLQRF